MVEVSSIIYATLLGLQIGFVFALIAIGLSIIFGLMEVVNFAHGSLFMLGAYVAYTVSVEFGSFWLAVIIAPVIVGLIGAVMEVTTIRPLYDRPPFHSILVTFGLVIAIQEGVKILWGTKQKSLKIPSILQESVTAGAITFPLYRIFLLVASIAVLGILWAIITQTDYGLLIRASTHDAEMVTALGINVGRLRTGVFVLGAGLAGIAGVFVAGSQAITPEMDAHIIIIAFAIVIIGGLGDLRGTVIGAVLVGLITSFAGLFAPSLTDVFVFGLMVLVLLLKPEGLLGRENPT
ncbi:branched-chain amino acid ABC transporter permease [Halorubrum trueperi]|uniref:Branched-chain amino acid ABC transporter permease n=1 Tax=Halorubrum trueperi TaxID=2004704 RepID=A0ABD5USE9_9EURY